MSSPEEIHSQESSFLFIIKHLEILHSTIHLALVLLLLDSLTLIKFFLTTAEGDINLSASLVIDEYECRHDGEAHRLGVFLQTTYLTLVEQKLTVSLRLMVVIRSIEIWIDIHSLNPYLTVVDIAKGINK